MVGAVGGLLGAVGGTMVLPGLGTIGGASVGAEISKGAAGDVTKTLTGQAYENRAEVAGGLGGKARAHLERFVEKTVKDLLGGSDTDSSRFEGE